MEVSQVKETLGKEVLFTLPHQTKKSKFTLTAYIYRVDPKNPKARLYQVELLDTKCNHCVVIASIQDVGIKNKDEE